MNVAELSQFIVRLSEPLAALGTGPQTIAGLKEAAAALQPFAASQIADWHEYLRKVDDYRKSGTVPADLPELAGVRTAATALSMQLADPAATIGDAQKELGIALVALAADFGMKLTAPKIDPKWLTERRALQAAEPAIARLKALAARIVGGEAVESEGIQHEIQSVASLDDAALRRGAIELQANVGTKAKPKTGVDLVLAALAKITGLPLDAKPKGKAKTPKVAATGEQVIAMTDELKALVERSKTPEGLPESEVDAAMEKVRSTGFSTAQLKDIAFLVTGVKEKGGPQALLAIRGQLTAARRGAESEMQ
jgi:hypothetical protein